MKSRHFNIKSFKRLWKSKFKAVVGMVLLVVWCGSGQAEATPEEIVVLQDSLAVWVEKQNALQIQQIHLQTQIDSLAYLVDQLKRTHKGGTASGALEDVLRQSLSLTFKMEMLYQQEVVVGQAIQRIRLGLRKAYDQEIDHLILSLQEQPDSNAIFLLQSLRKRRNALDVTNVALPTVTIGEDDTPDDIRLKSEFMMDVALHLQREKADVDKQLKQLLEEQRLRARLTSFTNEFGLFDEASPQGRSVVASTPASVPERGEGDQNPDFDVVGIVGPASSEDTKTESLVPAGEESGLVDVGREVSLEGLGGAEGSRNEGLGGEIQRLRRRKQILTLEENRVQERVVRLQKYLQQLLEGQTP